MNMSCSPDRAQCGLRKQPAETPGPHMIVDTKRSMHVHRTPKRRTPGVIRQPHDDGGTAHTGSLGHPDDSPHPEEPKTQLRKNHTEKEKKNMMHCICSAARAAEMESGAHRWYQQASGSRPPKNGNPERESGKSVLGSRVPVVSHT